MATLVEQLREAARRGAGKDPGMLSAEEVALSRMQRGITQPMDVMPSDEALSGTLAAGGRDVQGWNPYSYRLTTPAPTPESEYRAYLENLPRPTTDAQINVGAWVPGNAPLPEVEAERRAMPSVFTVDPETGDLTQMAGALAANQPRIRVNSGEAQAAMNMEAEEDARREAMLALERRTRPAPQAPKPVRARPGVEVQRVGGPPELAGRLGGAPLAAPTAAQPQTEGTSVTVAPSAANLEEGKPSGLQSALEEARQRRLMSALGRAADMASTAISGAPSQVAAYDQLASESRAPVADYLLAQQEEQRAAKSAEEVRLKDPNSPESQRVREYLGRAFPGVYTPEELAQVTAADRDAVLDVGRFKAEAQRRAKESADRLALEEAERTARATEAEKQRTFSAGEAAKQRALQRELAGMRQGDPQTKADDRLLKLEGGLRKEFEGHQVVKDYRSAKTSLLKLEQAANQPGAAGSLALTFGIMKLLDPTSVVKETEKATVENARGVPDRIRAVRNRVLDGDNLTAEQRQELLAMARGQFSAYETAYNDLADRYANLASEAGATPGRVAAPTAPRAGGPDIDLTSPTPTGRRKRDKQGREWEEMSDGTARPVGGA